MSETAIETRAPRERVDESDQRPWKKAASRPILDDHDPTGFLRYPYYTVGEVGRILSISDDLVRTLFRSGRHGRILEICNAKPGRRVYRTILIPYATLVQFIHRFSKGD